MARHDIIGIYYEQVAGWLPSYTPGWDHYSPVETAENEALVAPCHHL